MVGVCPSCVHNTHCLQYSVWQVRSLLASEMLLKGTCLPAIAAAPQRSAAAAPAQAQACSIRVAGAGALSMPQSSRSQPCHRVLLPPVASTSASALAATIAPPPLEDEAAASGYCGTEGALALYDQRRRKPFTNALPKLNRIIEFLICILGCRHDACAHMTWQ